jgi:hypothetical protein
MASLMTNGTEIAARDHPTPASARKVGALTVQLDVDEARRQGAVPRSAPEME